MKNNTKYYSYYSFRIKLEKLKQKTWLLIVLAKALVFLVNLIYWYLRQT